MTIGRKIRMGMLGGSKEGFIGRVHRMAAALDGQIELVCGVFSSNKDKSLETARELWLDEKRVYNNYEEMIFSEKQLPVEERMDFLSVVTPNHLHFLPSKLALENGFPVLCEKPLAFSLEEALDLKSAVDKTGLLFGVTHNYTGYPMVKEAKELIKQGELGKLRKVIVEYPQGWLSENIEQQGQKQASWRTDPSRAGISCCVGDIGTHAENLAEYITGLKITEVCAEVSTFVSGRTLDDDVSVLLRFENGVKGVLMASQVLSGEENELKIRVYGENGGIEWLQSSPNTLLFKKQNEATKILRAGSDKSYLSENAKAHLRLPGGHPEGYIESLANIYRNFARAISTNQYHSLYDFPSIEDGVRGMKFVNAVIDSGKKSGQWVKI